MGRRQGAGVSAPCDWIWPAFVAEEELHRAARLTLIAGTAVRGLLLRAQHLFDGATWWLSGLKRCSTALAG